MPAKDGKSSQTPSNPANINYNYNINPNVNYNINPNINGNINSSISGSSMASPAPGLPLRRR